MLKRNEDTLLISRITCPEARGTTELATGTVLLCQTVAVETDPTRTRRQAASVSWRRGRIAAGLEYPWIMDRLLHPTKRHGRSILWRPARVSGSAERAKRLWPPPLSIGQDNTHATCSSRLSQSAGEASPNKLKRLWVTSRHSTTVSCPAIDEVD